MAGRTPHDLAIYVYGRLSDTPRCPSIETLDNLFHRLFLTSLRTEEGTPITCSIAFVDPANPDPDPPQTIRDPRWTYAKFSSPIDYSVSKLAKLALAANPSSSCLGVYPDRAGNLKIWGLFDQQDGFQSYLSHENDGGWGPPGLFHVQVMGPAHLVVMNEITLIAELNGDNLVENSVDIFENRVIRKKLRAGFERRIKKISKRVEDEGYPFDPSITEYAFFHWMRVIRRILLRARLLGHGGAFLLTDSKSPSRLSPKYSMEYNRLPDLFENWISNKIIENQAGELIHEESHGNNQVGIDLYYDETVARADCEDATEALSGAVGFVSSLTRVDGLVHLDYDLQVQGFGCEITTSLDRNCKVFQTDHAVPSRGKLRRLNMENFGTRHRSMIRYCSRDPKSIGFVVSHDGPVRAISRSSAKLYFWDNVQLALRTSASQ